MVGMGFALGVFVACKLAAEKGIDPDSLIWFFAAAFAGGVIGGRLAHVVMNTSYYSSLLSVLDMREGGLSIHGVLLGGMVSLLIYVKYSRVPFGTLVDIASPGVVLGQGIGRIGCFFSGCCYGISTSGTWGVLTRFAPGLRHPYQLYESTANFLIFALLMYFRKRFKMSGHIFLTYIFSYSASRFFLEFLRDNSDYYAGLSMGQWVSLITAFAALVSFLILKRRQEAVHK